MAEPKTVKQVVDEALERYPHPALWAPQRTRRAYELGYLFAVVAVEYEAKRQEHHAGRIGSEVLKLYRLQYDRVLGLFKAAQADLKAGL